MRILHSGTLDAKAGGPAMSTYYTLLGLKQLGVEAEIIMYPLSPGGRLRGRDVEVHYATAPWEHKLAYSSRLKKEIAALGDYDLYHAQGVWQFPTYALVDVARKRRRPYLITPRGMLYPQDIRKSNKFFKMLSLKWRLLDDLNRAACIHVTCREEMEHCRDLGVTAPIAIIPNPVEIKEYTECKRDDVFRLGYLGRLSPRKNVEEAELLIIGGGDAGYEAFLKAEVEKLGLKNVRFTGFLSGKEKDEAMASLSVLAMPSEFENQGNAVLEGLIRGIPCIATKGAPWEELATHRCGWWTDYSQAAITEAISAALQTPVEELARMGQRGRQLAESNYAVEVVAGKMLALYSWLLERTPVDASFIFEK